MKVSHCVASRIWGPAALCLAMLACGGAPAPAPTANDPSGISRRDPGSLHAHQNDWPRECAEQKLQSPIILSTPDFADAASSRVEAHFGRSTVALVDEGHTLQIRATKTEDHVAFEGKDYRFLQLHFHKPSEHIIDGKQYEMELHVVFATQPAEGAPRAVLVLGFPIMEGHEHPSLRALWSRLAVREGYGEDLTPSAAWKRAIETRELETEELSHGEHAIVENAPFELDALLPRNARLLVYEGSLTTPACTEGVTHAVSTTPLVMSHEQVERFEGYYEGNNRDIQAIGPREPRRFRSAELHR